MKSKKTIPVEELKTLINIRIRRCYESFPPREFEAQELCSLLSDILMETENYHGFGYIDWLEGGQDRWTEKYNSYVDDIPAPTQEYLGPEYKRIYN